MPVNTRLVETFSYKYAYVNNIYKYLYGEFISYFTKYFFWLVIEANNQQNEFKRRSIEMEFTDAFKCIKRLAFTLCLVLLYKEWNTSNKVGLFPILNLFAN